MYRRNLLCKYLLKSKSARTVYAEISNKYPTMPFCARTLDSPNTRLALKVRAPQHTPPSLLIATQECIQRGLLIAYPVQTEKRGEIVAQQKFTALVRESGTERLTTHAAPYVHSIYKYVCGP